MLFPNIPLFGRDANKYASLADFDRSPTVDLDCIESLAEAGYPERLRPRVAKSLFAKQPATRLRSRW